MEETVNEALVRRALEKIRKPWCTFQKHPSKKFKATPLNSANMNATRIKRKKKRKLQKQARRVAR